MDTGYKVSDIMTVNPVKIEFDSTVKECAEVMNKQNVGSVLVMKKGKLAGILTEKDLVRKVVLKDILASKIEVSKIMTPLKDIVSIEPNKDIHEAMIVMSENEIRRLPVMTKNTLHGIITNKDVLKIQPDLFDLVVDKLELRESNRKLNHIDRD